MTCTCGLVTETIYRCEPCHRYWVNGTERISVNHVLRDVLPPTYDGVPEDRVERARERGVAVDALISAYVMGKPLAIPPGIPVDMEPEIKDLFYKFGDWYDRQGFKDAEAQVIVGDNEIAGALDLRLDGTIYDVKCTYDLLPSHRMQVAGYLHLDTHFRGGALIHLTKRYKAPKISRITDEDLDDWRAVRRVWSLKRRLSR